MNILASITLITSLLTLLTLIWLTALAFRKNPAWGLAVMLLSPFSATYFGIKYWQEQKTAFLSYIVTFSLTTALSLYLFTTWGGWELLRATYHVNRGIETQMLTARDAEYFVKTSLSFTEKSGLNIHNEARMAQVNRKLASEAEAQAVIEQAAAESAADDNLSIDSISKKVAVETERYRLEYMPINVEDAKNYVGSTVKVTRRNVPEKEYRLIGASGRRLELAQNAGRGSYSFHYNIRDIEKIRVLTKLQY
jgi:hypothetical protein